MLGFSFDYMICVYTIQTFKNFLYIGIVRLRKLHHFTLFELFERMLSEEGNIDRTEVSMEDLIFVGPKIGTHEMGFSKRLREAREAKERATTISQLSGITVGTKKSEKSITSSDRQGFAMPMSLKLRNYEQINIALI